jgi:spermidine/putrescine transport system ATP-binding protein
MERDVRPPDIVLDRVEKRFGDTVAVADLSLAVERGEFIALIGPSGCGKTTTLRMLAGLEMPTRGSIEIMGRPMDGVPAYERDTVTVWQHFALFPHLDVYRNVEFGLRMQRVPKHERRKRVEATLHKVGLAGMEHRDIAQLSGGQRQRVGLGRALVVGASVLLLDEPLGSLDANRAVAMQSELKALQRELGVTFIYVTHSQSEALAMADRIVVMNEGRIEQVGTPLEVYKSPRSKFVAQFVGTNNIVEGEVERVDGSCVSVRTPHGPLTVRKAGDTPPVGTSVAFVIRADLVKFGSPTQDDDNTVTGRLRGEEYLGSGVVFTVELDSGGTFKVVGAHSEQGLRGFDLNDDVTAWWPADDAFLLPWTANAEATLAMVDGPAA